MTNIERIQEYTQKEGNQVEIHPIVQTGLWLVSYKSKNNTWKIHICNPQHTTTRLVSKTSSFEEHQDLWEILTQSSFQQNAKIKEAVMQAKKHVEYYKVYKTVLKQKQPC